MVSWTPSRRTILPDHIEKALQELYSLNMWKNERKTRDGRMIREGFLWGFLAALVLVGLAWLMGVR